MENGLFSKTARVCALFLKYLLYLFNLALLGGLGVKTVNLWIARPFDFSDMVAAFPAEPEFLDKAGAEKQFLAAAGFETAVFVLGAGHQRLPDDEHIVGHQKPPLPPDGSGIAAF